MVAGSKRPNLRPERIARSNRAASRVSDMDGSLWRPLGVRTRRTAFCPLRAPPSPNPLAGWTWEAKLIGASSLGKHWEKIWNETNV